MAVLGSCPESYAEYREKVRGEYSFLSEPMYIALRLKVIILLNVLCLNISIPSHMYTLFSDYSFFMLKKLGTAELCADPKYFCHKGISRKI